MAQPKPKRKRMDDQTDRLLALVIKFKSECRKAPIKDAAAEVGMSYDYARRVVTIPHNRAKIAQADEKVIESALLAAATSKTRILEEYARLAFFDPKNLVNPETGAPLAIHELDEDTRRAVAGIKMVNSREWGELVDIKFPDKKGCLDSLSRVAGMFNDKVQIGVSFGDILAEVAGQDGSSEPLVGDEDD